MSRYDWSSVFEEAIPYSAFLEKYATEPQLARWEASLERALLTAEQKALLKGFQRRMPTLVLNGAWCGDCINQCPIFERFVLETPMLEVRYLDRDARPDVREELAVNGGQRVPVVVFLSEDWYEVGRFGDRPISTYRRMAKAQLGASCPTGLAGPDNHEQEAVIREWLEQFERAQLILRLSARLREKHGD